MKLDPIDPQEFTDYVAYSEKNAPVGNVSGQDQATLRSNAYYSSGRFCGAVQSGHVTLVFWRTLYLPEIQQHARYLAVELEIINNPKLRIFHDNVEMDIDTAQKSGRN